MSRLGLLAMMIREFAAHWARVAENARDATMLRGYWYTPQEVGVKFMPGVLAGYFSDLRHKRHWTGRVDADGIALNTGPNGLTSEFPITIIQKGLGHWDEWLISQSHDERARFLAVADWAVDRQDARGGWSTWPPVGITTDSPYSAMTQGEAMSLLVRAHALTSEQRFLAAARRAEPLMRTPIQDGGVGWQGSAGWVLEEYPHLQPETVLNGWIFAIFGLYDLQLADAEPARNDLLESSVAALDSMLPRFDAGYWSYYDRGTSIALPFYQRLHIAQLRAVALAFPDHAGQFDLFAAKFEAQWRHKSNRARAIARKIKEKLRNPPPVVLR